MKIAFTAGGTGGHFYPVIAVAEAIRDLAAEKRLIPPKLYYIAPEPYDPKALFDNDIVYLENPAGKLRRYVSLKNVSDLFVTLYGVLRALMTLFRLYPDVIFSKGGYGSVPTVLAARVLGIPVIIHESDAKPGRANLLAATSAYRIATSYPGTESFFPEKVRSRIAVTGIPIRKMIREPLGTADEAKRFLNLDPSVPTILVVGGSSGSKRINETLVDALPELVSFANIIHQTGKDLFTETQSLSKVLLDDNPNASRYHIFPYLSADTMRQAATACDLVISRAGSTSIAEIALWGKPAILIPIPEAVSHDQRTNAYAYARTGAATVLEEGNMTPNVLASEARRIALDQATSAQMAAHSKAFNNADAARLIADELLSIALSHENKKI